MTFDSVYSTYAKMLETLKKYYIYTVTVNIAHKYDNLLNFMSECAVFVQTIPIFVRRKRCKRTIIQIMVYEH